ncbi:MAG: diguanylate cyclase [Gammaproteobacteria bacterium]|jgi:diguanylate cyclase (GGDEF)-like protein
MLDKLDTSTLTQVMESCPVGILLLDENKAVRWMNDSLSEMLGSRAQGLQDKSAEQVDEQLKVLFGDSGTIHLPATDSDDEAWLICTTQQLNPSGQAQFLTDVSALRMLMQQRNELQEELKDLRAIDEETGLPNKKALFQSLEPQVSRSRRYNNPLSVIIMRITNLDSIQNKFAKDTSKILIEISHMLNDQMRWADIIGRLNDSDFLMVLPETHDDDANGIAEKVRARIEKLNVPDVELEPSDIKVSFGVAEWKKGDDVGLFMMRAREMLDKQSSNAA